MNYNKLSMSEKKEKLRDIKDKINYHYKKFYEFKHKSESLQLSIDNELYNVDIVKRGEVIPLSASYLIGNFQIAASHGTPYDLKVLKLTHGQVSLGLTEGELWKNKGRDRGGMTILDRSSFRVSKKNFMIFLNKLPQYKREMTLVELES